MRGGMEGGPGGLLAYLNSTLMSEPNERVLVKSADFMCMFMCTDQVVLHVYFKWLIGTH